MLGRAPPKETVQEAMKTHKPFGSPMSVFAQFVNAALERGSTEIQSSTVASHVEESAPPRYIELLDFSQMEPMPWV